jgi:pantoate--beta-alanine ligase
MVRDLNMQIEVVGAPIVREEDGLAMSSRNVHLSGDARRQAVCLSQALERARAAHTEGELRARTLMDCARDHIAIHNMAEIDYIELVDPQSLLPIETVGTRGAVMALAVFVDGTRLIDNTVLEPTPGRN